MPRGTSGRIVNADMASNVAERRMIYWQTRAAIVIVGVLILIAAVGGDILSSYW